MTRLFVPQQRRRAITWALIGVLLPVLLGMAALTYDVGIMYTVKADLQNAADAAAMAAIGVVARSEDYDYPLAVATDTAADYVRRNPVLGRMLSIDPASDVVFGQAVYDVDLNSYSFTPGSAPTNAVRVSVRHTANSPNGPVPLVLARVLGLYHADIQASATTMFVGSRYEEKDCGFVPPAGKVLLCYAIGLCPDDSDDSGAGDSDDSDDSSLGNKNCFRADSESGPVGAGAARTILVDASAAANYLADGAVMGPCACIPGDPDDSDDSESGDSDDSDDSGAPGGNGKMLMCHTPPANPTQRTVLIVDPTDIATHLAHGDTMGDCPGVGDVQILLIE